MTSARRRGGRSRWGAALCLASWVLASGCLARGPLPRLIGPERAGSPRLAPEALEPAAREAVAFAHALEDSSLWRRLASSTPVGLPELLERAREADRRLAAGDEQGVRARIDRIRAWAGWLPHLAARYDRRWQQPGVPALASGERPDELLVRSEQAALEVRWPLLAGLARLLEPARARAAERDVRARERAIELLLAAVTTERFVAVLEAEQRRRLEQQRLARLVAWQRRVPTASARRAVLELERLASEQALERAREAVRRERLALSCWVGAPVAQPLRPPRLAGRAEARRLADAPLAHLVSEALRRRPDMAQARAQLARRRIEARQTLLDTQLPSLDLRSQWYLRRNGLREGTDWDASLSLRHGLFEGWQGSARWAKAESRFREEQLRFVTRVRAVTAEVTAAWHRWRASRAAEQSAARRLARARAAAQAITARATGRPDGPRLQLEAERQLARAERAAAGARLARLRALVLLGLAVGDDALVRRAADPHDRSRAPAAREQQQETEREQR